MKPVRTVCKHSSNKCGNVVTTVEVIELHAARRVKYFTLPAYRAAVRPIYSFAAVQVLSRLHPLDFLCSHRSGGLFPCDLEARNLVIATMM